MTLRYLLAFFFPSDCGVLLPKEYSILYDFSRRAEFRVGFAVLVYDFQVETTTRDASLSQISTTLELHA